MTVAVPEARLYECAVGERRRLEPALWGRRVRS